MDSETVYQVVLSLAAVALFVVAAAGISQSLGETADNGGITIEPTGGAAIVAAIGVFILFLAAAGVWIERQDFES